MSDMSELERRAKEYAESHQLTVSKRLGVGTDGEVWKTNRSAVKVFERPSGYETELRCYAILRGLTKIAGLNVPQLINHDEELMVVEMSIVTPPFILDFAKARFQPPPFDAQTLDDHFANMEEMWEEKWSDVKFVMWELREKHGIHYLDVKRGNIAFDEDDVGTHL